MNIERLTKFNILYLDKKYLRVIVGLFFLSCIQIPFINYLILISYLIIYRGIYLTVYNKEENYLKKRILKVLGTILFISFIIINLIVIFQINESQNIFTSTIAFIFSMSFIFFIFLLTNISIIRVNNNLLFLQLLLCFLFAPLCVLFIKDKLIKKISES